MSRCLLGCVMAVAILFLSRLPAVAGKPPNGTGSSKAISGIEFPIIFEENVGQAPALVTFFSRTRAYDLLLEKNDAVLSLHRSANKSRTLRIRLLGARSNVQIEGLQRCRAQVSYFLGREPRSWHPNVPVFGSVILRQPWPGIDLIFHGNGAQIEFDVDLAPGIPVSRAQMAIEGADVVSTDDSGNLSIRTGGEVVQLRKPVVYQNVNGKRRHVDSLYHVGRSMGPKRFTVSFTVAAYDRHLPITIDPVLAYASFLDGKNDEPDGGRVLAIAVDSSRHAYITGRTFATDFPTTEGAFQRTSHQALHYYTAYVAEFNLNASGPDSLVYSTYLGGSVGEVGTGITIDENGAAYVTGYTTSPDFPVTSDAYQATCGTDAKCNRDCPLQGSNCIDNYDAFVTVLSPAGDSLIYSTFVGGRGQDLANGIAISGDGRIFIAGSTESDDFPTTASAFEPGCPDCRSGHSTGFIAEVNRSMNGTAQLVYSTYFGGRRYLWSDSISGLALDSAGMIDVAGTTWSPDFPVTSTAFQSTCHGCVNGLADAFVARLDASAPAQLTYSSFLGGYIYNQANAVALDSSDNIYVAGYTTSGDFPTTSTAFQPTCPSYYGGLCNSAIVTKFDPKNSGGDSLVYSSYLSSTSEDSMGADAIGIAIASPSAVYLTGLSHYPGFPVTPDAIDTACFDQAFVTQLNPLVIASKQLVYSTCMGSESVGTALAVDHSGAFFVAGGANNGLEITPSAYQSSCAPPSPTCGFLAMFSPSPPPVGGKLSVKPGAIKFPSQIFGAAGATSGPRTISLRNSINTQIANLEFLAEGDFAVDWQASNCPETLAANAGCNVALTFTPTGLGTRFGKLTINSNASNAPNTVALSGRGVMGPLRRSPAQLAFGAVPIGTESALHEVSVRNPNRAPIGISQLSVSGDYAQQNYCVGVLAPGASCLVTVVFTPKVAGMRRGTLTISGGASNSPLRVNLSGRGVPR